MRHLLSAAFVLAVSRAAAFDLTIDDSDAAFASAVQPGVSIFMYHGLDAETSFYAPSFVAQMDYLAANKFNTITLEHVKSWIETGLPPLPTKPIVLTFDDNYLSVYTVAFPALRDRGFMGYNYAHTSYVGIAPGQSPATSFDHADWIECAEMEAAGVMFTESHTRRHLRLSTLTNDQKRDEIINSKLIIEQQMPPGKVSTHFCYPYGDYDASVLAIVAEAGYLTGTTTSAGITTRASRLLELPRYGVNPNSAASASVALNSGFMNAANAVNGAAWPAGAVAGAYGTSYRQTSGSSGTSVATWSFTVPEENEYEISAHWPEAAGHSTAAKFVIQHRDGWAPVTVNQQASGGQWNSLGVYTLPAGTDLRVTLVNDSAGIVAADAIRISTPSDATLWKIY